MDIPGTVPTLPSLGACDGVRLCERVSGRGRTGRRLGGAGGAARGTAEPRVCGARETIRPLDRLLCAHLVSVSTLEGLSYEV